MATYCKPVDLADVSDNAETPERARKRKARAMKRAFNKADRKPFSELTNADINTIVDGHARRNTALSLSAYGHTTVLRRRKRREFAQERTAAATRIYTARRAVCVSKPVDITQMTLRDLNVAAAAIGLCDQRVAESLAAVYIVGCDDNLADSYSHSDDAITDDTLDAIAPEIEPAIDDEIS